MNITVPSTIPTNWKEIAENPILGAVITDKLKNGKEIKFPDEEQMNENWTNAGGWNATKMRRHLREDIVPLLPDDLREVIVPRAILQNINGEIIEPGDGPDDIWLLSATEVFGDDISQFAAFTGDHEDIHFDLYSTEKSRVKECGNRGTWPYWLRSPHTGYSNYFWHVNTNGSISNTNAHVASGVAFGFLINP